MAAAQYSTDGRFRFAPRNPFARGDARWWTCTVGNSDTVAGHGTLAQLRLLADAGDFDHLITSSTSLYHSTPEIGF